MIEILLSIILFPFAALAVIFTGALGVGLAAAVFKKILKINE
jgi:hypothetical protein